jgi:iron complex transport system ATP-binding protein
MKDGAIVASGDTSAVIRPNILERVFGFPMQVERIAGRLAILHHI